MEWPLISKFINSFKIPVFVDLIVNIISFSSSGSNDKKFGSISIFFKFFDKKLTSPLTIPSFLKIIFFDFWEFISTKPKSKFGSKIMKGDGGKTDIGTSTQEFSVKIKNFENISSLSSELKVNLAGNESPGAI